VKNETPSTSSGQALRFAQGDEGKAMNRYYVYMITNHSGTLYVGVTNDLQRRAWKHKQKLIEGFTKRYNITRLVYYEETPDAIAAILVERNKSRAGYARRKSR
jgi:putative endonuclease